MVLVYLQSCYSLVLFSRYSLALFIRSFVSSLPVPFPINSVLLFVLICWIQTYACPRLRLQPNLLVPQPRDSWTQPSPVSRTCNWITLDIIVCRLTTLDCVLFPEACQIKEYLFFFPEFHLAIGSCYLSITEYHKDLCLNLCSSLYICFPWDN